MADLIALQNQVKLESMVVQSHLAKGDLTSAIKKNRKIGHSLLKSISSSTFNPTDTVQLIKMNKKIVKQGLEMMDYMLKVRSALDSNVAMQNAISQKEGNTHQMSEEERIFKLYNTCVIKKFSKTLADISGNSEAIKKIEQFIIYPQKYPQLMENCMLPNGILLFGPPGNGKTMLAMATGGSVNEGTTFFRLRPSDFKSSWYAETDKNITAFFTMVRRHKPAIVYIDEVEGVCSARGSKDDDAALQIKSALLQELGEEKDGENSGISFIGSTNVADMLDPAFLRRFQRAVYIGLPKEEARKHLLTAQLAKVPNILTDSQVEELVDELEGWTSADIIRAVEEATSHPVEKVLQAKLFVQSPNNFFQCLKDNCDKWHPAFKDQDGACSQDPTLSNVDFCKPPLTYFDLKAALETSMKSVTSEDLYFFKEFGKQVKVEVDEVVTAPEGVKCSVCKAKME